jgi:thiamine-phosphate pyrophosphorylase
MRARPALGRLYLITDRAATEAAGRKLVDTVEEVLTALAPGWAVVQLREKDLPARELILLCRRLLQITREHRCPLLVNDRLDVALAAGADGVHLPENGLDVSAARRVARQSDFLIGRSTHSADSAGAAARDGADLVVCGPVWETPSKRDMRAPIGDDELARACRSIGDAAPNTCVAYAIGGIENPERAREAIARGAHGVAVVRAGMGMLGEPGNTVRAISDACHM